MSDYIKREDAIDAVCGWGPNDLTEAIRSDIETIPAADVRPVRRGEWTTEHLASTGGGTYAVVRCSECSSQFPMLRTNFCPACGADMREEG